MAAVQKVGFIGLGAMGVPMAARLSTAGFELYVSDAVQSQVGRFVAENRGSRPLQADDIGSLDALITMLPNSNVVEAVLLGNESVWGYARALKASATVIDMSSSEPARSRALQVTLEKMGIQYLDAPVSGGVKRAATGSLAILVGGDCNVLERHRAVLASMGNKIVHVGTAGAGHASKALNNYVSAAGIIATVEALHIAQRFGVDPELLTDVLNVSTGQTNTSLNKVNQYMLNDAFNSGFAMQLMRKDLGIAIGLADALGYPMAMGHLTLEMWKDADEKLGPGADHTEIFRTLA